jgi:hypothetical protein
VDWYDATLEEGARSFDALSPEEKWRLRQLGEAEQQVSLKAIDDSALGGQRGLIRML